jgi:hypothetical protein
MPGYDENVSAEFLASPSLFLQERFISLSALTGLGAGGFPPAGPGGGNFRLTARHHSLLPFGTARHVDLQYVPGAAAALASDFAACFCPANTVAPHGNRGTMLYSDFRAVPGPGDAEHVFTSNMNGCAIVVVTAVPGAVLGGTPVPPLPAGCWRMYHDPSHAPVNAWIGDGFTVRFAAYSDPAEFYTGGAGAAPPPAFAGTALTYNPNGHAWGGVIGGQSYCRNVTNFLSSSPAGWTFHSCHFFGPWGVSPIGHDRPTTDSPPSTQHLLV